jgi:hypothetical protein
MARLLMDRAGRVWVEIDVTRTDIAKGIFARTPRRHRFTGLWYGTHADRHASFGKMLEPEGTTHVGQVGRSAPAYLARKLGQPARLPLRGRTRVVAALSPGA